MEKAHVAAGGPFCGVRRRRRRFYIVLPVAASKIGFLSVIGSPDHRAFSMYGYSLSGKVNALPTQYFIILPPLFLKFTTKSKIK